MMHLPGSFLMQRVAQKAATMSIGTREDFSESIFSESVITRVVDACSVKARLPPGKVLFSEKIVGPQV